MTSPTKNLFKGFHLKGKLLLESQKLGLCSMTLMLADVRRLGDHQRGSRLMMTAGFQVLEQVLVISS